MTAIIFKELARYRSGADMRGTSGCLLYNTYDEAWALSDGVSNPEIEEWDVSGALTWATEYLNDQQDYERTCIYGAWQEYQDPYGRFWLPITSIGGRELRSDEQRGAVRLYAARLPVLSGGFEIAAYAEDVTPDMDRPVHLMTPLGYLPLTVDDARALARQLTEAAEVLDRHS